MHGKNNIVTTLGFAVSSGLIIHIFSLLRTKKIVQISFFFPSDLVVGLMALLLLYCPFNHMLDIFLRPNKRRTIVRLKTRKEMRNVKLKFWKDFMMKLQSTVVMAYQQWK